MANNRVDHIAIDKLAAELAGDEIVDAGRIPTWRSTVQEWIALLAQPVRLARAVGLGGEPPRLDFHYVLLDWSTEGPYPDRDAMILTHAPDPENEGCHANAADHWEAVTAEGIEPIARAFPESQRHISRASSFKSNTDFKSVLRLALRAPHDVFLALEAPGGASDDNGSTNYAAPVCRTCGTTATEYRYLEDWDRVQSTCAGCGDGQEADILELDYRVDRRVLNAAVAVALRPAARLLTLFEYQGGDMHRMAASLAESSGVPDPVGDVAYVVAPFAIIEPPDLDLDVEELVLLAKQLEAGG